MTKRNTRKGQKSAQSKSKSLEINQKAQWDAYHRLEMRAKKAWAKLRSDIKRHANPQTIMRDHNNLLLLLGECNYMTRECMRCNHPRSHNRSRAR